jgi:hypothetical protein
MDSAMATSAPLPANAAAPGAGLGSTSTIPRFVSFYPRFAGRRQNVVIREIPGPGQHTSEVDPIEFEMIEQLF